MHHACRGLPLAGLKTLEISYWNSYVGVGQMGGHGTFIDPRIGLVIRQTPDRVTPQLDELLAYQLSLETPEPPRGSFDRQAANRGRRLFRNEAGCASCHQGPLLTDVMSGPRSREPLVHDPNEVGTERDTPDAAPPVDTGRRHYAPSGSIRRTSTTAARRTCRPSSNTTMSAG